MTVEPNAKSFIEVQFPVSKLSKESYTERKAGSSQTLTGLGRWWGRKPLTLVRAILLGLLLPATDDPYLDREIFLKLLTMDEEGLWRRKDKKIPPTKIYELLSSEEVIEWFEVPPSTRYRKGLTDNEKEDLQKLAFSRLSFDQKMEYCCRPEEIDGPSPTAWNTINTYLTSGATSLPELIKQLGETRFGHIPRLGDPFCGGGSVPFEAARLGCDVFASDLNPAATFLTWAGLNLVGGGSNEAKEVRNVQERLYEEVDLQITNWGVEHNEKGWRASTYLYCLETTCPACNWCIPLSATWLIVPNYKVIATLKPDPVLKRFDIMIESGVSQEALKQAEETATVRGDYMFCPNPSCQEATLISMIRGDSKSGNKLRLWEKEDLVPRCEDIFQERLYCIRWIEFKEDTEGKKQPYLRHFLAPDEQDIVREKYTLKLIQDRLNEWQSKGYIPSRLIDEGDKTSEPIRTRGWTHWHHLFNPRQLLTIGLFSELSEQSGRPEIGLLLAGKLANNFSRLCRWRPTDFATADVFSNQALNTLFNYGCRTIGTPSRVFIEIPASYKLAGQHTVITGDCRAIAAENDIWISDPPYADAINYHELSEFFLAWYEKKLPQIFNDWYTDSRRALAISGAAEVFRRSMVDCYRNLVQHMPENGLQVVMFTHQDAGVWADLALILWAAGLCVTAAWCIGTETNTALKEGNYVQGTVILILRKQIGNRKGYLTDVYPEIELEVKAQLESMEKLEDNEDPNFSDTDYQLAAYAAALRVLTGYTRIGEIDVSYELSKVRKKGEISPVEKLIDEAVRVACDYRVPIGFDTYIWKRLTPEERFYLKGLDIARNGEYRTGAYQELARGFGLKEYKYLLGNAKANQAFLKTATEFGERNMEKQGFGTSAVRNVLYALYKTASTGDARQGRNWLRAEVVDYWDKRKTLIEISHYLSTMSGAITHWKVDGEAAYLLTGALENDYV